jgi:hypothetical protein
MYFAGFVAFIAAGISRSRKQSGDRLRSGAWHRAARLVKVVQKRAIFDNISSLAQRRVRGRRAAVAEFD